MRSYSGFSLEIKKKKTSVSASVAATKNFYCINKTSFHFVSTHSRSNSEKNMLYFLSFCLLFNKIANAQFRSEGDERDPLQALDVPFVPEDFRSSPKRIIFDKNDYVSLLPSQDLQKPLTDAIIKLLQETQVRANDSKVRPSLLFVCLKITEKVLFNITSEASNVYILSRQKLIKNAKNGTFWRVFENLKFEVKQCYQTGHFY